MKIQFEDKSYIEIGHSPVPGKIILTISAKDHLNALKTIANSVEITIDQLKQLVESVR
jgi:hypothetical protein